MHDFSSPAAAGASSGAAPGTPSWQTVGLRARATADLLQPLMRRLAWAHHGLCLALLVQLVAASLAHVSRPPTTAWPVEAPGLRQAELGPRTPPHRAG